LVNHGLTAVIVAPILMLILYPIVKARGLYWHDRYQSGTPGTPAAPVTPATKSM
jgi:hypothetical protein